MADKTRSKAKDAESGDNADLMNELKLLNAKVDNMHKVMERQVNSKFDSLHGSLKKLISESQDNLKKELEKTAKELRYNLDMEVGILCSRMEGIEQKIAEKATQKKSFGEDVSLVIMGLPQEDNEDLMAKVKDLFCNGLVCDPVPVPVAVERTRARGSKPGLVKVELQSIQVKVDVLRRKAKLRDSDRFQRVYVSSAKSHAERLLDYNFRTLLREIPAGKDFYLAGNGRLMKRSPTGGAPGDRRV